MTGITRQELKDLTVEFSGASAVGVTTVCEVSDNAEKIRRDWIADGFHADMKYLERYEDVRHNPALLLDGAETLVMAAFSYANPDAVKSMEVSGVPTIAEYALGKDYHIEVRRRLEKVACELTSRFGGTTRICVDTAPLRERYWAQQAGLGFVGTNNYLIIPDRGAHFFLGVLLWTGKITDEPDKPCTLNCGFCGKCVKACPTGALTSEGRLDARKCLSYLTIECKGQIPEGVKTGGRIFGCDVCRRVCPHEPENPATTEIEAFVARPDVLGLTAEDWRVMTRERFNALFADSAVNRALLDKLKANLASDRL